MLQITAENFESEVTDTVKFAKVNVDEQEELARRFRVMSIPMLVVLKAGQPVKKTIGALGEEELRDFLREI